MGVVNPIKSWDMKQNDKFTIELRFGKWTVLEISYDVSDAQFKFNLLSLLVFNKKFKKKTENK